MRRGRGITPADAGKTKRVDVGIQFFEDHPRGCGENTDPELLLMYILGSPPRMRGKLPSLLSGMGSLRITPADAGKP